MIRFLLGFKSVTGDCITCKQFVKEAQVMHPGCLLRLFCMVAERKVHGTYSVFFSSGIVGFPPLYDLHVSLCVIVQLWICTRDK